MNSPGGRGSGQVREHLSSGQSGHRVAPLGRNFGKWRERESPLRQTGMREDGIGRLAHETSQVQDIHVDFPRAAREGGSAASAALDPLGGAQESLGRPGPPDPCDGVPEPSLPRVPDRIGTVEGGDALDGSQPRQFLESLAQVGAPVSDV